MCPLNSFNYLELINKIINNEERPRFAVNL